MKRTLAQSRINKRVAATKRRLGVSLVSALALLTACTIGPEYPLERDGQWTATAIGGSMGAGYSEVTLTYNWDSVRVGDVCAYVWRGKVILHRVQGKLRGNAYTMKGDLNFNLDPGVMTRGNYVGTVTYR